MSSTERQVVVDDRDPSIRFSGTQWERSISVFEDPPAEDIFSVIMGGPYNGTTTSLEADGGFVFFFTGSSISVSGGINFIPLGSFGNCSIDRTLDLQLKSGIQGTHNNVLCSSGLTDGTHELRVELTGFGTHLPLNGSRVANRFWLDKILYTPSTTIESETPIPAIVVLPEDPQLVYSTGWQMSEIAATSTQNCSVEFSFYGTSAIYYPLSLVAEGLQPLSISYSVDEGPSSILFMEGTQTTNVTMTAGNTPLFNTRVLPAGHHTLKVVNTGNASRIPLSLASIIVTQPTLNVTGKNIRLIVGVTVGPFFLLLLLLLLFLRWRRQVMERYPKTDTDITTSDQPTPFPLTTAHPEDDFRPRSKMPRVFQRSFVPTKSSPQYMVLDPITQTFNRSGVETSFHGQDPLRPRRDPRPLSDLVINHDDSGIRLTQPSEEEVAVAIRRVVELPPIYIP